MVPAFLDKARQAGPSSLAWLSSVRELSSLVSAPELAASLAGLHAAGPDAEEVDGEAMWLGAGMAPRSSPAYPRGLVRDIELAGPFEDAGSGLTTHEGPEAGAADAADGWDRGAIRVRRAVVPRDAVSARGVPTSLMVRPRGETCTYLGASVELAVRTVFRVRIASAGAFRAMWDGREAALEREVHSEAVFDRAAFRVEASPGEHSLLLKVCSGPSEDDGYVRVRVQDDHGEPLELPWRAAVGNPAGLAASRVALGRTLLSRALDTGKRPSGARALEAALTRRFGGAEDSRTPRVPGLLDAVSRERAAAPMTLALAAWATPFRGASSGRLLDALARAGKQHDRATQSFVLRRLAEQRIDSGFADWAQAALETEPLASETDPEAALLRARAMSLVPATKPAALDRALGIATEVSSVPSVWDSVSSLSRTLDRRQWGRAEERLWQLSGAASCDDHVRALAARSIRASTEAAIGCGVLVPLDAGEVVAVGRSLTEFGQAQAAREVLDGAGGWLPNVPSYWTALADAHEAGGPGADTERAYRALQRAADLEPTNTRVASRLALSDVAPGAAGGDDGLADASVFLARKRASPAKAGVQSERLLHWYRKVQVLEDRRVAQTLQYAREIVVAPRTPHELEEDLPMQESGMEILRARVLRADGGIAFAEEQESDGERSRVRWPELRRGDVVEVALRTITAGPVGRRNDAPFYFVDYIGSTESAPLLYGEVEVEAPVDQQLAIDVLHGEPDQREDRVQDGKRMQRFRWTHPRTVADEPLSPEATELVPTVVGSTFSSWKEFLDWYRTAVEGFTEPDEQVRALAAELTAGLTMREQKLRKLFAFVADEIRYVNFVSGEAWLPNRPQEVLARRQGDCDDKAILLIALLRAVGIDATEVLLQSRYTGEPSVLLSTKAAVPLFDHGIAYLPGPAGAPGIWLDPTIPQSRLGPVPALDTRGLAVFVHDGVDRPVPSPRGSPDDHGVSADWTIRLNEGGGGELHATESHAGDDGQELRAELGEPDTRAGWVEKSLLAGWLGGVRVQAPVDFKGDVGDGVATVEYTATSNAVARQEGATLVVPVSSGTTLAGTLAPLASRTLPLVLPADVAPGHERRVIRLVPPSGYEARELAPGGEESGGPFGRAKLSIARDGSAVVVTRELVLDQSEIPVTSYAAWRGWLQRVDALMQRSVRFSPQQGSAAAK